MEEQTKPWWQSKTIWGALITIIALILSLFGVQIDEQTKQVLINESVALATAVAGIVGAVLSIYGRIKAKQRIK